MVTPSVLSAVSIAQGRSAAGCHTIIIMDLPGGKTLCEFPHALTGPTGDVDDLA